MDSSDGQVGGDGQFMAWARAYQSAIVTDAEANGPRFRTAGVGPDVPDDGKFAPAAFAGFG
jgi:hypothetical protein